MEGRPMHAILKEGQDGKLLTKSLQNYQTNYQTTLTLGRTHLDCAQHTWVETRCPLFLL